MILEVFSNLGNSMITPIHLNILVYSNVGFSSVFENLFFNEVETLF